MKLAHALFLRLTLSVIPLAALIPAIAATLAAAPPLTREFPTPAPAGSHCANLTAAPDGTLHLTYYAPASSAVSSSSTSSAAPAPATRALWHATLAPGATAFSTPRPIIATPLLMENWADFASLCIGTDGALTAQWFQKTPPDAGGYDGWFSRSDDGGRTWRTPARLGHEFVVLAPLSQGRTLAVWLESTRVHDAHAAPRPKRDPAAPRPAKDPNAPYAPSMKLLARLLAPDGTTLREWTVDPDVCTCCQNTVAVLPGDRVFTAYRGHTPDEIRDNRSALFDLATLTWSAPTTLRDDGWKIAACPVNGPAVDAHGPALAVAWFTAAGGVSRVHARTSPDAGRTFTAPVTIDLGRPMGRIETVQLADQTALILWMEIGTAENTAGIYARRLWPDGTLSAAHLVADSSQARTSGFPRAALRADGRVVMSFTRPGETTQVRLLELDPAALPRPTTRSVTLNSAPSPLAPAFTSRSQPGSLAAIAPVSSPAAAAATRTAVIPEFCIAPLASTAP